MVFLAGASLTNAASTTYSFNTTLEAVSDPIRVSGDFSFAKVIPGREYAQNFTVSWAVPPESLRHFTDDRAVVFVKAYASPDSWIRFRKNNRSYKSYAFTLECRVRDGACWPGSTLEHVVAASIYVPENATRKEEIVRFEASLTQAYKSELARESSILDEISEKTDALGKEIGSISEGVHTGKPAGPDTNSADDGDKGESRGKNNTLPRNKAANLTETGAPLTAGQTDNKSSQSTPANLSASVAPEKDNALLRPITALLPSGFKDVIFVVGILTILALLWGLGKLFPEKTRGLDRE